MVTMGMGQFFPYMYRENFKTSSCEILTGGFEYELAQIIIEWHFVKVVQIFLIGWKTWPQGARTNFPYVNIGKT